MSENSSPEDDALPAVGKPYWVYLLECEGNCLYCGIALDVRSRFAQHVAGTGAAYTRSHKPLRIVGAVEFESRSLALKAEIQVKKQPKSQKLGFLRGLGGSGHGPAAGPQLLKRKPSLTLESLFV